MAAQRAPRVLGGERRAAQRAQLCITEAAEDGWARTTVTGKRLAPDVPDR